MHITQGDYEGKAVIISWVTPDEPGPNTVQYGTSDKSYEFTAEGTVTNYTFYKYKSGYIHHCLVGDLKVTECSFMIDGNTDLTYNFKLVIAYGSSEIKNYHIVQTSFMYLHFY